LGGSYARTGLPSGITSATYDAANRLTNWAGNSYAYDANGNLTSDGVNTYSRDARNQLASMSGSANATFLYDPLGRRVSKTIGGVTTGFLYDGFNVAQELSGSTPTANLLTGGIDEIFTRTGATAENFLADGLGSTVATTDTTGAVATQYSYEPFGNTSATGSVSSNAFQYTGRENDGTGLFFYRARYYHPRTQRFISQDPIGFAGGDTNLYAYAFNSPTNFIDPSGLCAPACTLPIAAGPPGWVIGAGIAIATLPIWGPPAWQLPRMRPILRVTLFRAPLLSRLLQTQTAGRRQATRARRTPCKKAPKRSPNAQPPKNAPQLPPKEIPPGWNLRQMPGASSAYPDFYPYGYWILYNPFGQPIDPSTMKPGRNPEDWHIPYPEPCE
jgi:RHS repeat-associated protein